MNLWPRRLHRHVAVGSLLALSALVACNRSTNRPQPSAPAVTATSPSVQPLTFTTPYPTSSQVTFTLEGCRNDGNPVISLPNGSGKFICPDAAYTTGNLGKGWNELDLVPHRLTMNVGDQAGATTKFLVVLAADYKSNGFYGYDVLSAPEVNAGKSDGSCTISVDSQKDQTGITGGTDSTAYRMLNVDLSKGKTCVIDYYQRLALGAAQYPGSSLQAYMFEDTAFKTGKRTIPLPVREILPQTLSKTMVGSQGRDQVWDVAKNPTPAVLSFGDVCSPDYSVSQKVQIKVSWEIKSVSPGDVSLITRIYATNPAARVITVQATDKMYRGTDQTNLIDTFTGAEVDVPANTADYLVAKHIYPYVTSSDLTGTTFNDVATATYIDKVTGVAVPGSTEAKASAQVSAGTTLNATASISDSESMTGTGLSFTVATPSLGNFTNYVAGTPTTGPVNWQVTGQTGAGSVTFDKNVLLDTRRVTTGTLSDTASLQGSDGATAQAGADVGISSTATVKLTITKTIPNVLQSGESQEFAFVVKDAGGQIVATPSITFNAGETSKSVDITTDPGVFTVTENPATGWAAQAAKETNITLPTCAGGVTFQNVILPAKAKVVKTTLPAGTQGGWTFTLKRGGVDIETATTDQNGNISFATDLTEGSYTITETLKAGYKQTSSSGCGFTVNYPADANRTYTCAVTNTLLPKLTVVKVVLNEYGGTRGVADFPLYVNGTPVTSGATNIYSPGTYTASEISTLPYGYTQDSITGDCDSAGKVTLNPGDNKTCTITNSDSPATIVVIKNAKPATGSFGFTTSGSGYSGFTLSPASWTNTQGNLSAGTYSVREDTQLGWLLTGIGGSTDPNTPYACVTTGQGGSTGTGDLTTQTASISLKMGDTVTCTFENTAIGQGVTRTQGFWATHPNLAIIAWNGGSGFNHTFPGVASTFGIGDQMLCGRVITAGDLLTANASALMGGFWSDIAKTTLSAKRSALDQARMQLLQQMLAAELNASAFGSAPSSGSFTAWETAYCGTNTSAIKTAHQQAASFNTSGDSGTFTPGTSANSRAARMMADRVFWNTLP